LKARVLEGEAGGLKKGGLESGMLRGKFPFVPGMYVEMRAKLTKGIGAWPAFWLGCGVQKDDGTFSELPWPPEIDIFEFFNWQGRPKTKVLTANIQTNKQPEKFGNPYTIFSALNKEGDYIPGMDFGEEFHVFALDWQENRPVWILDGHPIKQAYYEWNGPPAHILVTNQLGISFGDIKEMKVDESNWNYVIDYIRVWKKKSP
jgi:beta-glucanase (GH16 family)